MRDGKAIRIARRLGHCLNLTIGIGQRHGGIICAAVCAEFVENRELNFGGIDIEALASPAQALAHLADRAVEIGWALQDAGRNGAFDHAGALHPGIAPALQFGM